MVEVVGVREWAWWDQQGAQRQAEIGDWVVARGLLKQVNPRRPLAVSRFDGGEGWTAAHTLMST